MFLFVGSSAKSSNICRICCKLGRQLGKHVFALFSPAWKMLVSSNRAKKSHPKRSLVAVLFLTCLNVFQFGWNVKYFCEFVSRTPPRRAGLFNYQLWPYRNRILLLTLKSFTSTFNAQFESSSGRTINCFSFCKHNFDIWI